VGLHLDKVLLHFGTVLLDTHQLREDARDPEDTVVEEVHRNQDLGDFVGPVD
jgi:hypothetical protein